MEDLGRDEAVQFIDGGLVIPWGGADVVLKGLAIEIMAIGDGFGALRLPRHRAHRGRGGPSMSKLRTRLLEHPEEPFRFELVLLDTVDRDTLLDRVRSISYLAAGPKDDLYVLDGRLTFFWGTEKKEAGNAGFDRLNTQNRVSQ